MFLPDYVGVFTLKRITSTLPDKVALVFDLKDYDSKSPNLHIIQVHWLYISVSLFNYLMSNILNLMNVTMDMTILSK